MFDPRKPVQTRDGREAKVYEVYDKYLHGAYKNDDGSWDLVHRTINGLVYHGTIRDKDFVNIPEKFEIKGWVNVYPDGSQSPPYETKEFANIRARYGRIACIFVDMTVNKGQGL